jgi:hypothetical protein
MGCDLMICVCEKAHEGDLSCIALNMDGSRLATASDKVSEQQQNRRFTRSHSACNREP